VSPLFLQYHRQGQRSLAVAARRRRPWPVRQGLWQLC
jgi:hypothetical protein